MLKKHNLILIALSLFFHFVYIFSMEKKPSFQSLQPESIITFFLQDQPSEPKLELPWSVVQLSEKMKGAVEDFHPESIPLDGSSLETLKFLFSSIPKDKKSIDIDDLKIDEKLGNFSLQQLTPLGNNASNLLLSSKILERIGSKIGQLILTNQELTPDDYSAIKAIDSNFFKQFIIDPTVLAGKVRMLIIQQKDTIPIQYFNVSQKYLRGKFFDNTSIVIAVSDVDSKKSEQKPSVQLYDIITGKTTTAFKSITEEIHNLLVHKDMIAVKFLKNDDHMIALWKLKDKQDRNPCFIKMLLREPGIFAFSPSNQYLGCLTAEPKKDHGFIYRLSVWKIDTINWSRDTPLFLQKSNTIANCELDVDGLNTLTFVSDNQLLVVGYKWLGGDKGDDVQIIKISLESTPDNLTCKIVEQQTFITGLQGGIQQAVFSSSGKLLALAVSAGPKPHWTIIIYDIQRNKIIKKIETKPIHYSTIAFSADENILACGSNNKIFLYDVTTGEHIKTIDGLTWNKLAFSPNDNKLLSVNASFTPMKFNFFSSAPSKESTSSFGIWNLITEKEQASLNTVNSYNQAQWALLYRQLFQKDRKIIGLKGADNTIAISLDSLIQETIKKAEISQNSWGAWIRNLPLKYKAALSLGAAAIGYGLYKYLYQAKE